MASQSFSSALLNAKQFQLIRDWPCREYAAAQLPLVFAKTRSSHLCFWASSAFGSRRGAITRKHMAGLSSCVSCREEPQRAQRAGPGLLVGAHLWAGGSSKHRFSLSAASFQCSSDQLVWNWVLIRFCCRGTGAALIREEMSTGKIKLRLLKVASDFGSWVLRLRKFEHSFSCRSQDFSGCDDSLKLSKLSSLKITFLGVTACTRSRCHSLHIFKNILENKPQIFVRVLQ